MNCEMIGKIWKKAKLNSETKLKNTEETQDRENMEERKVEQ